MYPNIFFLLIKKSFLVQKRRKSCMCLKKTILQDSCVTLRYFSFIYSELHLGFFGTADAVAKEYKLGLPSTLILQ